MDTKYTEKILVVDDEPNLLAALRLQLRAKFDITTAEGAREGWKSLEGDAPFAVVMSDMRMPEVNGVEFLARAREISPDTVRIMLTENADLETAMTAVNESAIFRFLVKPCQKEKMELALEAAIGQHRLVVAERELLENTLNGSVQVLADILSLVSPFAFSRATRASRYVKQIATELQLEKIWQYELAALLSQIGYITLPADTRAKLDTGGELTPDEIEAARTHPEVGSKLLAQIPRLESVAKIVAGQNKTPSDFEYVPDVLPNKPEMTGALILKAALDFDLWIIQGFSHSQAIGELKRRETDYHPSVLKAFKQVKIESVELKVHKVPVRQLNDTMILAEEIRTKNGMLVAAKGQPVSQSMRVMLNNYLNRTEIDKEIVILAPGLEERLTEVKVAVAE